MPIINPQKRCQNGNSSPKTRTLVTFESRVKTHTNNLKFQIRKIQTQTTSNHEKREKFSALKRNDKIDKKLEIIHWDRGGVIRTMLLLMESTAKSSPSGETRIEYGSTPR